MATSNPYTYNYNRNKTRYVDKVPPELDNPRKRFKLNPKNRYLLLALIAIPLGLVLFAMMGGFPH